VRRHPRPRRAGRALGLDEHNNLCTPGCSSPFASDEERRAFYFAYRDQVLASVNPGLRPVAYYQYEAAIFAGADELDDDYGVPRCERCFLERHELTTEDDRRTWALEDGQGPHRGTWRCGEYGEGDDAHSWEQDDEEGE
jgi:hypothetical protein